MEKKPSRHQDSNPRPFDSRYLAPLFEVTSFSFQCLIDDDRSIRMAAFQALDCVLKICKVKRKRTVVPTDQLPRSSPQDQTENGDTDLKVRPGVRSDNEWMQYKSEMSEQELSDYWDHPFSVNAAAGYYAWPKPEVRLHVIGNVGLTLLFFKFALKVHLSRKHTKLVTCTNSISR